MSGTGNHIRLMATLRRSGLDLKQRVALCLINGLQGSDGCYASNAYVGEDCDVEARQAGRILASLIERGLVRRTGGRNSRRLWITDAGRALLGGSSGSEGEAVTVAPVTPLPSQQAETPEPPATPKKERADPKRNPTIAEHSARALPDFIPRDAWVEFVTWRHKEKGPFTDGAAKGVVRKIERLRSDGHDPVKLLNAAIENNWLTVFPGRETKAAEGARRVDPRDTFTGSNGKRVRMFGGRPVL